MPPKSILTIAERILHGIEIIPECGCWIWVGASNPKGYGKISIDCVTYSVHRVSYEAFKHKIQHNMNVLHHCDTPSCCNPDHLFIGTKKDNSQDACKKGRIKIIHHVGEKHGMSKLLESEVRDIKISNKTLMELSKKYNVSIANIWYIRQGKTWKHILTGEQK